MELKEKLAIVIFFFFFAVTVALAGKGNKVMLVNIIVVIEITELACVVLS